MVRTINVIRRSGSKQNDIKYFSQYLPESKIIVEVFGGGFSVIKNHYKDIEKYNFHINDLDKSLYYIYNHAPQMIGIFKKMVEIYKTSYEPNKELQSFKKFFEGYEMNEDIRTYIRNTYFIRGNLFTYAQKENYDENEFLILKNSKITNSNYTELFEMYKDNEESFLFLDPLYLFSNNSLYQPQLDETDSTKILVDILDFIKNCKCKVMLIINKLYIIDWMFKDFIKGSYSRTYQVSKRKQIHLIITNY